MNTDHLSIGRMDHGKPVPDDATWIAFVRDTSDKPKFITSPKGEKAYFRQNPNVPEGQAWFTSASLFRGNLLDGITPEELLG